MNANCCRKWYWFIPLALVAVAAAGIVTMLLWNALLPVLFHLPVISFCQALGILVLARLLFGGLGCHGRRHGQHIHNNFREKWENMTPEDREHFHKRFHHHSWCCKKTGEDEYKNDAC